MAGRPAGAGTRATTGRCSGWPRRAGSARQSWTPRALSATRRPPPPCGRVTRRPPAPCCDVLPPAPLQPDTRHIFRVDPAGAAPATHVRLEIHPDGGLARLRLFGELTAAGRAHLGVRWLDRLPADHVLAVLARECGLDVEQAAGLAGRRPFGRPARLESLLSEEEFTGLGGAAARVRALILGPGDPPRRS